MFKIKYRYTIPKTCITLSIDQQFVHKQDSWSVDTFLAEIALPLIIQLKKNTHSYPGGGVNDIDIQKALKEVEQYWNGVSAEEWNIVLDKITMAFQYYSIFDDIHQMYFDVYKDTGYVVDILQELEYSAFCGMLLFVRYYQHLWD